MNTNLKTVAMGSTLALGLLLLGGSARAAETTPSAQLSAAAQCEAKAADLQASIDADLKLKADNLKQWVLRKSPMNSDIAAADKKYDAEIAELRATQSDWLELAHMHRLQALELQTAMAPSTTTTAVD